MKLREIILDFTSLLDVIMIILFWFILNYRQEMNTKMEQAEQTAANAVAAAEQQMEDADKLSQQAEEALAALSDESKVQSSNVAALLEFSKGENVNVALVTEEEGWHLDIYKAGSRIGRITDRKSQRIGLELNQILSAAGYEPEATILCVFSYDSTAPGTRAAYEAVTTAFQQIKTGNRHFYYTEVDSALTGEE